MSDVLAGLVCAYCGVLLIVLIRLAMAFERKLDMIENLLRAVARFAPRED